MRLRASTDLIVIMSACPQDLLLVNGLEQQPTNVHFRVHAADRAALDLLLRTRAASCQDIVLIPGAGSGMLKTWKPAGTRSRRFYRDLLGLAICREFGPAG